MDEKTEFSHPPRGHVAVLGYDIVNKRWRAVYVDDDGHVSVDVEASALPTGAATSAKQLADGHNVTVDNPSLAVTGDFYQETQPVSLASAPTTVVTAEGGDVIFNVEAAVWGDASTNDAVEGTNYRTSTAVPEGKVWVITYVLAYNSDTDPAKVYIGKEENTTRTYIYKVHTPGIDIAVNFSGQLILTEGQKLVVTFTLCAANDNLRVYYHGYQMDAPT